MLSPNTEFIHPLQVTPATRGGSFTIGSINSVLGESIVHSIMKTEQPSFSLSQASQTMATRAIPSLANHLIEGDAAHWTFWRTACLRASGFPCRSEEHTSELQSRL